MVCDGLHAERRLYGRAGEVMSTGGENIFMFAEQSEDISSRATNVRERDNGENKEHVSREKDPAGESRRFQLKCSSR